jgi:hypothetical protein
VLRSREFRTETEEDGMSLGGTDLNLLNALRVLLEEVNVTHAGRRLNMGQPAMSGALARLRRQFGDELLVRSGRDYELTPMRSNRRPAGGCSGSPSATMRWLCCTSR